MEMAHISLGVLNNIPVIGHLKGVIQRLFGDGEAADQTISEANRTTAVLFAGAAGFYLAGVPLAVLLGATAGAEWDLGSIIPSNGEKIQGVCKIVEDPANLNAWIDATVDATADGLTGAYGGKIVQAAKKTAAGLKEAKSSQEIQTEAIETADESSPTKTCDVVTCRTRLESQSAGTSKV
ncbi:uncharacterized protein LOC116920334 [Daphnia magna]|uniref:uncharacterized protein LOC116920334 n=1 Tax=Daphnia magna TaxID=35525 RepID=UPI001E1BB11C|nr:uncharacterized protein LOC116920334 [Daphnia magna]